MKTEISNEIIACTFDLPHKQAVSATFLSAREAFQRDVLVIFGPRSLTLEDLLENCATSEKRLSNLDEDQVTLILDGTYIRHQKSTNDAFQRRSYSGQKKTHLCKAFTLCTTDGFIVDFGEPFPGTMNDASIVKEVLKDSDLLSLLRPSDVLVVDRGFRDVVDHTTALGFKVVMPAKKGRSKQLSLAGIERVPFRHQDSANCRSCARRSSTKV